MVWKLGRIQVLVSLLSYLSRFFFLSFLWDVYLSMGKWGAIPYSNWTRSNKYVFLFKVPWMATQITNFCKVTRIFCSPFCSEKICNFLWFLSISINAELEAAAKWRHPKYLSEVGTSKICGALTLRPLWVFMASGMAIKTALSTAAFSTRLHCTTFHLQLPCFCVLVSMSWHSSIKARCWVGLLAC